MRRVPGLSLRAALFALVSLALVGCPSEPTRRYTRAEASAQVAQIEGSGLVIGEYGIDGAASVLDGDTIKVNGLDASLRLLAIDTEETFKRDEERRAYASRTIEAYRKFLRGDSPRPVKMATPLGDEAKKFAQKFFEGVTKVRLERDHPGEIRDFYNRYLAYVFVEKNGEWVNYNLEAVKAGMSPYFTKYGRSRRFHEQFVLAQRNAREKKLGVWDPDAENYGDYDERLKWWDARGDTIWAFENEMETHPNYIALTRYDALQELERKIGQEVVLLASVSEIKQRGKGPIVVRLSRTRVEGFDVVFFDKDVYEASKIGECKSEFVRVRGKVRRWTGRRRGKGKGAPQGEGRRGRLQIIVSHPDQVTVPENRLGRAVEPEQLAEEAEGNVPGAANDNGAEEALTTEAAP